MQLSTLAGKVNHSLVKVRRREEEQVHVVEETTFQIWGGRGEEGGEGILLLCISATNLSLFAV